MGLGNSEHVGINKGWMINITFEDRYQKKIWQFGNYTPGRLRRHHIAGLEVGWIPVIALDVDALTVR